MNNMTAPIKRYNNENDMNDMTAVATHPASIERYNKYVNDNIEAFIMKWFPDEKTPFMMEEMSLAFAISPDDGSLGHLKFQMDITRRDYHNTKQDTLEIVIDGCDFIAWYDNGRNKVPEDVSDDEYNGLWQWKDGRMVRADHIRRIK